VLDDFQKAGMEVPDWAVNAPDIPLGSDLVFDAYQDLSSCRSYGWGAGPIPWTAVRDYATARGMDDDEYEEFAALIRMLDLEYLKFEKQRADSKTAK
jgi:hypothetical protein